MMFVFSIIGILVLVAIYLFVWGIWCKWQYHDIMNRHPDTAFADLPTELVGELVVMSMIGFIIAPMIIPIYYVSYGLGWFLKELAR